MATEKVTAKDLPQPDPRGYASLDVPQGGVQSNLADLKPWTAFIGSTR
jgi:hypothetical protein